MVMMSMRRAAARQKASDKYVGEQKKQVRHGGWVGGAKYANAGCMFCVSKIHSSALSQYTYHSSCRVWSVHL